MSLDRRNFVRFLAAGTAVTALAPQGFSETLLAGPATGANQSETGVRSFSALKALVFDSYGTLFDVYSVASLGEQLFPGKGKELSQLWRTKQIDYTWLRSLMDKHVDFWQVTQEALDYSCKALNLECPPAQRDQLMQTYNHLTAFPDVRPALEGLAPLPLAILSNGSPQMLQAVAKNSGIHSLLRHIISVEEAGVFKPSPRVYQLAVDKFKIKDRRDIGFVSSNCWDALGAKAFGLTVFWINRGNAPVDELGVQPDRILSKLTELVPLVKS